MPDARRSKTPRKIDLSEPPIGVRIWVLLLFQLCALLVRSFLQLQLAAAGMDPANAHHLSWLVVPLILGALLFPALHGNWSRTCEMFAADALNVRDSMRALALGALLWSCVVCASIAAAAFRIPSGDTATFATPALEIDCGAVYPFVLATLVSVILTPLLEETVNRGYVLRLLLPRGRWFAVIFSALLFGVFHRPEAMLEATMIGWFLAVQFLTTRNLWFSAISHGAYNALVAVDRLCLSIFWLPPAVSTFAGISFALLAAVFMLAAASLYRRRRHEDEG